MKYIQKLSIAPTLLISYLVYSTFITNISISHSIIITALAGLYAYDIFLVRQENSSKKSFAQFKQEMEVSMKDYKEACNARFSRTEDEIAKVQLNQLPSKAASSSIPQPRKMVF